MAGVFRTLVDETIAEMRARGDNAPFVCEKTPENILFWPEIAGLLPGGARDQDGRMVYNSPLGASFGGIAFAGKPTLNRAIDAMTVLKAFAVRAGWHELAITLPPPIYQGRASHLPSFTLSHAGFRLRDRQLCFVLPLAGCGDEGYARLFRNKSAGLVRAARARGVVVQRGGETLLPDFLSMLHDTYDRHDVSPTHTDDELRSLLRLCPDRIRLHVTLQDNQPTGGVCVFQTAAMVDTVFYICTRAGRSGENGALVAIADAIGAASRDGRHWLDLGPSADHAHANHGVAAFKEHLGAEYHLREHWAITL